MPYVARTKDAKQKLEPTLRVSTRTVTLGCGCTSEQRPGVSNPDRWWCCGSWQARRYR